MVSKLLSASLRTAIAKDPTSFALYLKQAIPEQVSPFGLERISKDIKTLSSGKLNIDVIDGLPKLGLHALLIYLQHSVWNMEAKKKTKQWEDDKRSQAIGDNPNLLEVLKYDVQQQKTITKKSSRFVDPQSLDLRSTIKDGTTLGSIVSVAQTRPTTKKPMINEVLRERTVKKTRAKVKSNFEILGTVFANGLALEMLIGSDTSELSVLLGGTILTSNVMGYFIKETIVDLYAQTLGGIANIPDALKDKFDESVENAKDVITDEIDEAKQAVDDFIDDAVETATSWIPEIDIDFPSWPTKEDVVIDLTKTFRGYKERKIGESLIREQK